jgi:(p)ppGpp synthase/HD superfamily hydrolase
MPYLDDKDITLIQDHYDRCKRNEESTLNNPDCASGASLAWGLEADSYLRLLEKLQAHERPQLEFKMSNNELLNKMLVLVTTKHSGQFDKSGKAYIFHCLKVMDLLDSDDEELNCIALGHDLVEDTDVTYAGLEEVFGARVRNGIERLTKMRGESSEDYLAKVKSSKDSILVKLADLRHNSDITRLKGVTDKDIARTVKYHKMFIDLQEELTKF